MRRLRRLIRELERRKRSMPRRRYVDRKRALLVALQMLIEERARGC